MRRLQSSYNQSHLFLWQLGLKAPVTGIWLTWAVSMTINVISTSVTEVLLFCFPSVSSDTQTKQKWYIHVKPSCYWCNNWSHLVKTLSLITSLLCRTSSRFATLYQQLKSLQARVSVIYTPHSYLPDLIATSPRALQSRQPASSSSNIPCPFLPLNLLFLLPVWSSSTGPHWLLTQLPQIFTKKIASFMTWSPSWKLQHSLYPDIPYPPFLLLPLWPYHRTLRESYWMSG